MAYLADLQIGSKIYFKNDEPKPFEVKAKSQNFIIATVEDGAYKRYTIIDTENGICGPHDRTFNPYDFTKLKDIEECLIDMIDKKWGMSISRRHGGKVSELLDLEKTLPQKQNLNRKAEIELENF